MSTEKRAPGKSYRKGISLLEAAERFGDPVKAEAWLGDGLTECVVPTAIATRFRLVKRHQRGRRLSIVAECAARTLRSRQEP